MLALAYSDGFTQSEIAEHLGPAARHGQDADAERTRPPRRTPGADAMSEQLEPELERVARMLADAGPLPDAPATLRERALRDPRRRRGARRRGLGPDGGCRRAAAAPQAAGAHRARGRRGRRRGDRDRARRSRSCATTAAATVGHRIDLAAASVRPEGRRHRERRPARRRQRRRSSSRSGRCRAQATVAPTRPGSGARATAGRWATFSIGPDRQGDGHLPRAAQASWTTTAGSG